MSFYFSWVRKEKYCDDLFRYRIELNRVPAGNWVLIEGVDQSIVKTSTIVDNSGLVRGRRMNVTNIDDVSVKVHSPWIKYCKDSLSL